MPNVAVNIDKILQNKNIEQLIENKINDALNIKINELVDEAVSKILNKEDCNKEVSLFNAFESQKESEIDTDTFREEYLKENKPNNTKFRIYNKENNKFAVVSEKNKDKMPDDIYMKYSIGSYLSSINQAMNKLRFASNAPQGLFCLNPEQNEEKQHEDTLFYNFINNLSWEELDALIYNNENINKENIPPIIKEKTNPTDVYYIIIKNTLSNHINEVLNINISEDVKPWNAENYLKNLLLKELLVSVDGIINNTILTYNRQIFNTLFDKKYYIDEGNV